MFPSTSTVPVVGLRTPVMIFRIVDFPEPLVPMMPTVSPFFTSKESLSRAKKSL